MKVNETLSKTSNVVGAVSKDDRKVTEGKEVSFQNQLKRVESDNFEQYIQDLASKIFDQGEKLGKKVDIRELKIYKNMISEFLGEAVNNSHKFSKESFLDRRGRYKVYATIKKINSSLEQLTEKVLNDQKNNIGILNNIEDIRGLILDITL
jgi:hypothetical protein